MHSTASLSTIYLDCADPATLSDFYRQLTGWKVDYSDQNTVILSGGPVGLGFNRIDAYQGPGWPDAAKHSHLDFTVADVAVAVKELLAIGAAKPQFQPGGEDWTVMTDPEGHAFCLSTGE